MSVGGYPPYPQHQPGQHVQYWMAPKLKHSGVGITSFVLDIVGVLGALVLIAVVVYMQESSGVELDENSPTAMAVGLLFILGILLNVIGVILGLVSVFDGNRKRLFGILGLIFNGLIVLGVIGLVVLGLAVG